MSPRLMITEICRFRLHLYSAVRGSLNPRWNTHSTGVSQSSAQQSHNKKPRGKNPKLWLISENYKGSKINAHDWSEYYEWWGIMNYPEGTLGTQHAAKWFKAGRKITDVFKAKNLLFNMSFKIKHLP